MQNVENNSSSVASMLRANVAYRARIIFLSKETQCKIIAYNKAFIIYRWTSPQKLMPSVNAEGVYEIPGWHFRNEKSAQRRRKHCALAVVRRAKNLRSAADPFPGARGGQNLISWRWSLPSPTDPVRWRSMHAISSYRGIRPTNTQTQKQTGAITIHCVRSLSSFLSWLYRNAFTVSSSLSLLDNTTDLYCGCACSIRI